MSEESSRYTFWQLIENYIVEIPIIQRDYAQGRESEEEIRNTFLDKLYVVLVNDENLDLDFVYGSLKEIKKEKKFIPLDGQQRLTTLFLLHWYLAVKERHIDKARNNLINFTYETRSSSREFCNALVRDDSVFKDMDFNNEKNISNKIKNAYWFFMSWEKDPTIKAMLVMLDAIHEKFKVSNDLFGKLLLGNNAPISFQFIELENFGLEDSLYIKMNARGKSLTKFENFKAKLQQLLQLKEDEGTIPKGITNEFSFNMDGKWADLFWYYRDSVTNTYDKKIMDFIRALIINNYALKNEIIDLEDRLDDLIDVKKDISFSKYLEWGCFDDRIILEIITMLNTLENKGSGIKQYIQNKSTFDEDALFERVINNYSMEKLTYHDRVMLYSITQYFVHNHQDIINDEFTEWVRVVRNLSANTIDNNSGEFSRSIQSIKKLVTYSRGILGYFVDPDNTVSRFLGEQVEEERIKAILILKNDRWRNIITEAENHGYFKGQISFLLNFAGIQSAYNQNKDLDWSSEIDENFYNKFYYYYNKAKIIFSNDGLSVNNDLWRRALLCKGDYLLRKSRNLSFVVDSDRDVSWKRLLRDKDKRRFVKELFDEIDINNIEKSLLQIIEISTVSDWRKYFIRYPKILQACGQKRFIRKENENNILLLNSSTTGGYCKEYYTFALYQELTKDNILPPYVETRGVDYYKYIELINNDANIEITYNLVDNKWCYLVEGNGIENDFDTQEDVINYLKAQQYIS
ncbi:DUF262 domain-containing protein [Bacillus sp. CECT 9360]|uniref:DUF262 domain-containing protein n=1 Tax=Bacillus sp. CECT 9360 TaxID=2845821 RepID=UPI001E315779|nr:DUF262 domain-containing protein [Bacillus sp. CECT 9360]CAH0346765.1 hypothetical protein BCI9360_03111 [Bacillus sp. CECT 9360]